MRSMRPDFPAGITYEIIYNPSEYIRASVVEVQRTLFDATILVVLVVILFLQSWRTAAHSAAGDSRFDHRDLRGARRLRLSR